MSNSDIVSIVKNIEDQRVRVLVDKNEFRIANEVVTTFAECKKIFQRAGFLVEPRLDPARNIKGILRPIEELKMVAIKPARARNLASEVCRFVSKDKNGDIDASPPDWLSSAILSLPEWLGIPVVESVAENPTFRSDGTIHDVPGYDETSGNYFVSDGTVFPKVPENPTLEDAKEAYKVLMDPLCDFPFVTPKDKSVSGAFFFTILARPAIAGPTPPFVFRTPTPRTGKDLITDALTIAATGREATRRTLPKDDVELKKVLLSLGLSGCRVTSFGNCEGMIGSAALSHAVTSEVMSDRLLGANTDVTVPLRTVWAFNGNNPKFKSDFAPRVVVCDMDAGIPDPQSRTNWKYDPLTSHVKKVRAELVVAGLTILRAYHLAGRPKHGKPKKGSFEAWDNLVRGAILWLGEADPLETGTVSTDDDADIEQLRALLSAWRNAFGERSVTLADAVDSVKPPGIGTPPVQLTESAKKELGAAFAAINPKLDDKYTAATLRHYFRHNRGRPVDGRGDETIASKPSDVLRLEVDNPRSGPSKVASWFVLDGTTPKGSKPKPTPPSSPASGSGSSGGAPPRAPSIAESLGSSATSLFDQHATK